MHTYNFTSLRWRAGRNLAAKRQNRNERNALPSSEEKETAQAHFMVRWGSSVVPASPGKLLTRLVYQVPETSLPMPRPSHTRFLITNLPGARIHVFPLIGSVPALDRFSVAGGKGGKDFDISFMG